MRKTNRNILVKVENRENSDGFHIYLEFSGEREYLLTHRHNGLLFGLLKDGVILEDMRRWKACELAHRIDISPKSRQFRKLTNVVNHLLVVIDDYMIERAA